MNFWVKKAGNDKSQKSREITRTFMRIYFCGERKTKRLNFVVNPIANLLSYFNSFKSLCKYSERNSTLRALIELIELNYLKYFTGKLSVVREWNENLLWYLSMSQCESINQLLISWVNGLQLSLGLTLSCEIFLSLVPRQILPVLETPSILIAESCQATSNGWKKHDLRDKQTTFSLRFACLV